MSDKEDQNQAKDAPKKKGFSLGGLTDMASDLAGKAGGLADKAGNMAGKVKVPSFSKEKTTPEKPTKSENADTDVKEDASEKKKGFSLGGLTDMANDLAGKAGGLADKAGNMAGKVKVPNFGKEKATSEKSIESENADTDVKEDASEKKKGFSLGGLTDMASDWVDKAGDIAEKAELQKTKLSQKMKQKTAKVSGVSDMMRKGANIFGKRKPEEDEK